MLNLFNHEYNGINGIKLIDSGNEGPCIGISVCTHGGEFVGLHVLNVMEKEIKIYRNILKGKIFFILTNIEAFKLRLKIEENGKKIEDKYLPSLRFIDENMNRIKNISNAFSYEAKRIGELKPILKQLDIIYDIHSTYTPSKSISILTRKSYEKFRDVLNVDMELIGITKIQSGDAFINFIEREGGIGIGIESGYELDDSGFKVGIDNILRVLINEGMIDKNLENVKRNLLHRCEKKSYNVFSKIIIKAQSFRFYRDYSIGDTIKKGEKICFDGEKDIYAQEDCVIMFPIIQKLDNDKLIGEEGCFLCKLI